MNAASKRTDQGIAPGSLATIYGPFGQTPDFVMVGGIAAQIVYSMPSQAYFLVPDLAPAPREISVRARDAELAAGQFTMSAYGPGLFALNPADPSQPGVVVNEDYCINGPANPANAGSVVHIFATGYGSTDAAGGALTEAYFAGVPAQVAFSGTVAPGVWQIDAVAPAGVSGQVPLFIAKGGMTSNAVTVYVQ